MVWSQRCGIFPLLRTLVYVAHAFPNIFTVPYKPCTCIYIPASLGFIIHHINHSLSNLSDLPLKQVKIQS